MLSVGVLLKMRISGIKIEISPYFLILFAAGVFILPWRWLIGMFVAAAVHEMGHLLALRFSKISVHKILIGLTGTRIIVGPLTQWQECFCACAGPGAGALLIGLGKLYPELAICAFAQSAYNLIPMMPFDGGRIFRCAVNAFFPQYLSDKLINMMEIAVCLAAICIGIFCLTNKLMMGACLAIVFALVNIKGKITCNGAVSAVQ